jgi:Na+-translocating ferredoxin:NAD+ oxidoreductase subunit D
MRFETGPPPQWHPPAANVGRVMRTVLYALAPAALVCVWFYGPGLAINAVVAVVAALATEALALRLAGKPAGRFLLDGSAVVTAVLFAFALPPLCPWWVTTLGMVFGIGFAKHIYGGLGYNLFNPAMAAFALVLVSFPGYLAFWPAADIGDLDYQRPNLAQTLGYTLTGRLPPELSIDAVSRATTLDSAKEGLASMRTMDEIRTNPVFGDFGGAGWEWVNNFIAMGGFALLVLGIIRWQIPAAVLAGLLVPATLAWTLDAGTHPSPGFHLFSGGAMLCAFFIATDPVSSPTTGRGQLVYGAGIGLLTYVIRTWGSYPEGVAFAVLMMNAAVPLIDRYTRPRIYGRSP